MSTWILVLSLVTSNGTSIASVSGFKSKEECGAAGSIFTRDRNTMFVSSRSFCMEQTK